MPRRGAYPPFPPAPPAGAPGRGCTGRPPTPGRRTPPPAGREERAMKKMIFGNGQKLSRRKFVVGAAAAATGTLALGFKAPFDRAFAQNGAMEVNIWVAIQPDDTCVVRIARSEMGQGTLTR